MFYVVVIHNPRRVQLTEVSEVMNNLRANLSLLGAYVYPKHISVTITSQNLFNKKVYCRYFDCHRREIEMAFESRVFPESTVYCGRRAGAKFMSLTEKLEEKPQPPVPILDRTQPEPEHFFSICLAPLYGDEPKWMQIVEFIEHYKLQGADHFYIYLIEVSPYDRIILDDYVRTGEIDLIILHDRFERPDWLFHMVEVFDCLQRSKYHSKWSAFIDIDERMVMNTAGNTVANYLHNITDPKVGNVKWRVQTVLKTDDSPAKYENDSQLFSELIFMKYLDTMPVENPGVRQKCIVRPEMIGAMAIHSPSAMYPGTKEVSMKAENGVVRHYRNTKLRVFGAGNLRKPTHSTRLEPTFEKDLLDAVFQRVRSVYDIVPLNCRDIAHRVWAGHGLRDPCVVEAEKKQKNTTRAESKWWVMAAKSSSVDATDHQIGRGPVGVRQDPGENQEISFTWFEPKIGSNMEPRQDPGENQEISFTWFEPKNRIQHGTERKWIREGTKARGLTDSQSHYPDQSNKKLLIPNRTNPGTPK
ncbi:unnamed protein product [Caenorhabditis auriculariae]|uniref:Glycosyltransferase family 92 protein n=1 Tax=Caenorhabditis auriculariae TaxID=2777116 RepID=A0A8S1HI63_9PELO|nr:unnamed protein product [Caenorhabditis auriculariae]